jgi:hypothetical protein
MANPFARFFREDDGQDGLEEAHEIVAFANMPYFTKMMKWLESESDKLMLVGDHMDMILAAARTNTFKEVRKSIRHRVDQAIRQIDAEREDR